MTTNSNQDQEFELRIKQFEAVVRFTTAIEDRLSELEMKPSALARLLGKSRSWISKVLRKKPNLTIFTAVQIADTLGLDLTIGVARRSAPLCEVAPTLRTVSERSLRLVPVNDTCIPFPEIRAEAA